MAWRSRDKFELLLVVDVVDNSKDRLLRPTSWRLLAELESAAASESLLLPFTGAAAWSMLWSLVG